jgi:excisionase family DNA binding protein
MLFDEAGLKKIVVDAVKEAMTEASEYLSVARAAEIAEVHPDTIRGFIREGRLKRYKAGREWRVKRADLDRLLEEMARPAPLVPPPEPSPEEKQRENVVRMMRGE